MPDSYDLMEPYSSLTLGDSALFFGAIAVDEGFDMSQAMPAVLQTTDGRFRTETDSLGRFELMMAPGTYAFEASAFEIWKVRTDSVEIGRGVVQGAWFKIGWPLCCD